MGFNSAFKGLKLKKTGNGHLSNLNDLVLNVLNTSHRDKEMSIAWSCEQHCSQPFW